ncbi:hypothetical protein RCOM_0784940 [Ricinus communis]|uniref:AIG1-type G domain-containing protein n=1 Tax=Ricinus communis TaxID=3988 RepID=B9SB54_RICCO|nr:hypothetical protein RCOM_0784940 [Ricinus communis]
MTENIEQIRVKFLRLVYRLGGSTVAQVLYKLVLAAGIHDRHKFSDESDKEMAMQLEAAGKDDLDLCLNILVIGKTGVGKSATINSIFGEKKVMISAFEPATTRVDEIVGTVDGVRIRVLDTPGLRTNMKGAAAPNRKILASKIIKKFPPNVDRLDVYRGSNLNDFTWLASISKSHCINMAKCHCHSDTCCCSS